MIERLVRLLLDSDTPLERPALSEAVAEMLPEEAPLADSSAVVATVDSIVGLGPVEALLRDPTVSDVLVNGDGEVWVERSGLLELSTVAFAGSGAVQAAVERVLAPLGLRLDHASPFVDARLADGSRLHAAIPPVSVDGPVVAVRRFTETVGDLEALVEHQGVTADGARMLRQAVTSRQNIVISGGTGSGKTTLLNVLSKEIPDHERVVTVEDAAELRLAGHVVRLEARPANAEGRGAVTLRDLVRNALRLRPDRLVVGEVRGPEALDMIQAVSTGHDGSMSTVHANSPAEAMLRLETLALSGHLRVSQESVRRQLWSALDLVVHVERRAGLRYVRSVADVGETATREVYSWQPSS